MSETIVRTSGGVAYAATARCVCSKCNGGWMSQLENDAIPLLRPMIKESQPTNLWQDSQALLARWATKTAMMVQYLQPEVLIPAKFYDAFYNRRLPSPNGRVWLASYNGRALPSSYHSSLIDVTGEARYGFTHSGTAYGVTFHVDRLVFQVFDHDLPGMLPLAFRQDEDFAAAALPIWPSGVTRQWPPDERLDDRRLIAFEQSFDVFAKRKA